MIKDATDAPDIDTNDSIVTLSGITLPLTADAQDELRSDTALDITSGGYIDGTIKIYTYELSLIGKSKEAPAENTAKLKLDVPTYTVTYDANGGSGTMTDKNSPYAYGAAATVLTNGFTRSRYTFTGWNTEADGSGKSYAEGDPIKMLRNVVLYAQWTRNSSHDDDDKYFFAIQKVDAQDGHALNGAKFELYQLDKNDRIKNRRVVETRQQSSKNGISLFGVDNKNSYDGIWYYAEVSAPEGYVLDRTEYEINDKDFSDSLSTAVKYADTVRNYRGTTPDLLNDSDHFAYVIGYMDGNVRPYGLISRAETTTIFFRLLKDSVRDGNLLTSNTYTDVADDYWANTAISTMTGLGIVQGRSTTTFDPKAPITRAQFAAICARFDTGKSNGEQTFSDIQGHWAEKYIQRAAELGWIKGFEDGTFRPDTYITRAQAMTMINRVLNRIPEDESDLLPGMNVTAEIITEEVTDTVRIPVAALSRGDLVLVTQEYAQQIGAQQAQEEGAAASAQPGEIVTLGTEPQGYVWLKVESGLTDGEYVEITAGLEEGAQVYVSTSAQSGSESTQSDMGMGGMGMGAGMPAGMPSGDMSGGRPQGGPGGF